MRRQCLCRPQHCALAQGAEAALRLCHAAFARGGHIGHGDGNSPRDLSRGGCGGEKKKKQGLELNLPMD